MSLSAISQTIGQVMPSQKQIDKYYGLISNAALNLNKVAVPVIALLALSSATGAEAGPVCYATCMSACLSFEYIGVTWPFANFLGCINVCLPLLFLPTP